MTTDYDEKFAVWPRVASADALIQIMENDDFKAIVHARDNFNKFITAGRRFIPKLSKKDAMATIRMNGSVERFVKTVAGWVWDDRKWETCIVVGEVIKKYQNIAYQRMMANN